jgi:thioredoxin reductase
VTTETSDLTKTFDAVVIGGGAAGLSGATALARSRRSVLVIDDGSPRNAPADGVHNLLARDGISPTELLTIGRAEVRRYGGTIVTGEATSARRVGDVFDVRMTGNWSVRARRLLVATGLLDELPDVTGLRERWGREVVHCPYCHGWEIRDQALGVLGNVTDVRAHVGGAAAQGVLAGAAINADLIAEETAQAVETFRAPTNADTAQIARTVS